MKGVSRITAYSGDNMVKYGSSKIEGTKKEPVLASPLKNGLVEARNIKPTQPFTFWGIVANNGSGFYHGLWTHNDIEFVNPLHGIVLRSADGKRWRITVKNNGVLKTEEVV